MPTQADLDAALVQLKTAVGDAASRVASEVQDLQDRLAAALANGNPPPDFTNELAAIQGDITDLGNIAPASTPPAP